MITTGFVRPGKELEPTLQSPSLTLPDTEVS